MPAIPSTSPTPSSSRAAGVPRRLAGVRPRQPHRVPGPVRRRPAYGPDALREDFARFRFLLGVTDGEGMFTSDEQ